MVLSSDKPRCTARQILASRRTSRPPAADSRGDSSRPSFHRHPRKSSGDRPRLCKRQPPAVSKADYSGPACRCCRGSSGSSRWQFLGCRPQLPPEARLRLALLQPEVLDISTSSGSDSAISAPASPPSKGGLDVEALGPLTISAISLQYKEQGGSPQISITLDAKFAMGPIHPRASRLWLPSVPLKGVTTR